MRDFCYTPGQADRFHPRRKSYMVEIAETICIPESELHWTFVRAGGPGGQNVNKVASRAVLRWNVAGSPSLPDEVKARLVSSQRRRINQFGELILSSQRFRDQGRNVADCLEKLRTLIQRAAVPPKPRKPTRPTAGSREARLREKRWRSKRKEQRRPPADD
ncbi:MAG: aminoacyl-tRNA hydrolase [Gemmataceae bacterium]|nr:aminoacyl-tRNA hydrolase [Gemmataceae bacterium]MDW8266170.1 alternative ribosome rescue aminoacyl-tRNA hydrolase ArfB [Gemmataceae bacterium]